MTQQLILKSHHLTRDSNLQTYLSIRPKFYVASCLCSRESCGVFWHLYYGHQVKDRFSGAIGYISGTKPPSGGEGVDEADIPREESPPTSPPELPSFTKISAMSLEELGEGVLKFTCTKLYWIKFCLLSNFSLYFQGTSLNSLSLFFCRTTVESLHLGEPVPSILISPILRYIQRFIVPYHSHNKKYRVFIKQCVF